MQAEKPSPGNMVVLKEVPRGLLDGLPAEDQSAISEIIGKPIRSARMTVPKELNSNSPANQTRSSCFRRTESACPGAISPRAKVPAAPDRAPARPDPPPDLDAKFASRPAR